MRRVGLGVVKFRLVGSSVIFLVVTGIAQTPQVSTVGRIKTEITRDERGDPRYMVTGNYNNEIAAMVFHYGCPGQARQTKLVDRVQLSGLERMGFSEPINFGNPNIAKCDGGLYAVLYADGHAEGDPKDIQLLYNSRIGELRGIKFALPLLDQVIHSDSQQPHVLTLIASRVEEERVDLSRSVSERSSYDGILDVVVSSLTTQRAYNEPDTREMPEKPSVEAVMKVQQLSRSQAVAFVMRRNLLMFQATLLGSMPVSQKLP